MLLKFIIAMLTKAAIYIGSFILCLVALVYIISVVLLVGPLVTLEYWLVDGGSMWWFWCLYGIPLTTVFSLWLYNEYIKFCKKEIRW